MDSSKTDLIEKIKAANTVLVTVSRNPSIDQLAACIGFALILSKLKKHATAVFSGGVPSTIEFLKPEETLEKNTNSLRDFIIALDKSKADKLRYKIEDQMVKIFITPYRTSLSEDDLEFSQGDFNVDLVVTLGVEKSEDLDQAITASGNILHDATIVGISASNPSTLGSINWNVAQASSLCELVAELASSLGTNLFDQQIATALLTGVVAETERFSNNKTTSLTMSVSSQLMAAGANQQLVANELAEGSSASTDGAQKANGDNGELDINHKDDDSGSDNSAQDNGQPIPIPNADDNDTQDTKTDYQPHLVSEPPQLGGTLTANSTSNNYEPSTDPLSNLGSNNSMNSLFSNPQTKVPDMTTPSQPADSGTAAPSYTPPPADWIPPLENKDIESKIDAQLADPNTKISSLDETVRSAAPTESQTQESASQLKDQLNKLIPQEGATNTAPAETPVPPPVPTPPPAPKPAGSSNTFPEVLDPKDLQPPADPKAPPYPPPIVTPPENT